MTQISVIGAGTMGNGIAHVFAQHGFKVALVDREEDSLSNAKKTIEKNLHRQAQKSLIETAHIPAILNQISTFTDLPEGLKDSDLVIEAISEDKEAKLRIFKEIDKLSAPETILASNTSSISISSLASQTSKPHSVIGMHFMNPVPLMTLVEVIQGANTSKECLKTIVQLTEQIEKEAVVAKDYPGFIANRILMPMINEAIETLFQGIGDVAGIDAIMKGGMRHPMGPLQLADFIGLDVCLSILNVMYEGFKNPKYAPSPLLVNLVTAGHLGIKSGRGFYDYSDAKNPIPVQNF
ncbi:MAG: 3-hydroxyacyl-CoA dehydrogenase NAD-binding domain-containing protein [Flavobacteriaceae bacterium]|nr:3-hydroxyacyl-CoA dehydrogenase NAD-binding domain-containing protein [Flavobacteriaceae bacterium]MCI5088312.1 3-hydroxyacyl-CoA dehydrogenase NAD-binding domain-containing protein [Flavobacteriaceae bacterium]